jgi:putative transposase
MNPSHYDEYDYIKFWVATPKSYSCLEAGRVQPLKANAALHDAITRILHRKEPNSEDLGQKSPFFT